LCPRFDSWWHHH